MNVRAHAAPFPTRSCQCARVPPQLHVHICFKFNCIGTLPLNVRIVVVDCLETTFMWPKAVGRGRIAADVVRSHGPRRVPTEADR